MFVIVRTYNSRKKADYIKYRLELAEGECNIIPAMEPADGWKVEVLVDHLEAAVNELLKIKEEYPLENFELTSSTDDILRILVPIDFSIKSIEAVKYVIDIATHRPVEVKFLHVWDD